jgi:hypothetical protein
MNLSLRPAAALLSSIAVAACAHAPVQGLAAAGGAPFPARDESVAALIGQISAARLQATVRGLAAIPTRHTLSPQGTEAAVGLIEHELAAAVRASGGRLQVTRQQWIQPAAERLPQPAQLTQVIATLPGTAQPERVIVVSGHFDSRNDDVMNAKDPAPGSNDDGSGTALVIELARVLSQRSYPATIVFATVTGEEQGLYGAAHLADELLGQKRRVIADFTDDIVGNSQGQGVPREAGYVRVFAAGWDASETPQQQKERRSAGTDADVPARTLARAVADAARTYVPGFGVRVVYRLDRYLRGGDHAPFVQRGVAAVRFTEPHEDWRHQHHDVKVVDGVQLGDLPEYVDYDYLAQVTSVNAAIVAQLAAAPPAPEKVTLLADLSPVTTLSWDAAPGAAGYEVLWRETTAAGWQSAQAVTGTSVALPISKDDYLFAVRSVSAEGARSLPAIPVAVRAP